MVGQTAWLQRQFIFNQPIGVFPSLLERVRGTPARAKELVMGVREEILGKRVNRKWSAKEHLGHLLDLHPLDELRLNEFLSGMEVLSAADIENRATEAAHHRDLAVTSIIQRLSDSRRELTSRLEVLTEAEVSRVALHPRLRQPMRLLDWVYFLAEHDDHHLALARSAVRTLTPDDVYRRNR